MTRILVVVANEERRKLIEEILVGARYEVAQAAGGEEGARLFRENPAAIIIADIGLPDTDAVEMIRRLTREDRDVAIVAVSGECKPIEPELVLELASGFRAFGILTKPITKDELVEAVDECLALKS